MTSFRTLFDLRIKHDFYPSGVCTDLEVVPSEARLKHRPPQADPALLQAPAPPEYLEAGARALARRQLVVKLRPDGVEVAARCRDDEPMVGFADVTVAFALRVRSSSFGSFTKLPPVAGFTGRWRASRPTFVNGDGPEPRELEPVVGEAEVPPELLAYAEIRGVASTWVAAPRRFTIRFAAPEARWVYYIVKPGEPLGQAPRLIEDQGRLGFDAAELNPAADDPIAAQLESRYPEAQRYRLISQAEVPCRQLPGYRLRLSLDGGDDPTQLSAEPVLALPDIHEISQLKITPQDPTAQQCFYKVVTL